MDSQQFFNIAVITIGALGGWYMRIMWEMSQEHKKNHGELKEKVANIEVLVVGEYVKRDDVERISERLISHLEKFEEKNDRIIERIFQKLDNIGRSP